MNRYQGPLKNPLSLVLPDGTTFRLTEAEVCLSVYSGVDALAVKVSDDALWGWVERATTVARGLSVLLVGHSVTLASAVLRSSRAMRLPDSEPTFFSLDLLLRDGDGPALLRHLSEPIRSAPLSTGELAALAKVTADDDPADLIPRLLATVAVERERGDQLAAAMAKANRASEEGEAARVAAHASAVRVLVATSDGRLEPVTVSGAIMETLSLPGSGAGGVTRPRGMMG